MVSFQVKGTERLIGQLRAVAGDIDRNLGAAAKRGAQRIQKTAKEKVSGPVLRRDSGRLASSIHVKKLDALATAVGSDVVYAAIHEFGGDIRPRRAKYLSIPIGTLRGSPRKHSLRVVPTRSNLFLVDASGRFQYVLKKHVRMPKRPWLIPSAEENREEIVGEFEEVIRGALHGAAGMGQAAGGGAGK